jgi:hypothetical protein
MKEKPGELMTRYISPLPRAEALMAAREYCKRYIDNPGAFQEWRESLAWKSEVKKLDASNFLDKTNRCQDLRSAVEKVHREHGVPEMKAPEWGESGFGAYYFSPVPSEAQCEFLEEQLRIRFPSVYQ